jgi:hypothetical protein
MRENFFTLTAILAAIILYILFLSPLSILVPQDSHNGYYYAHINDSQIINDQYHLDQQQSVLYLEIGDAPFFFRANSSCRYVNPIMLTRNRPEATKDRPAWDTSYLPQYREEYNCIRDYQGKFIVMQMAGPDDWLGENVTTMQPLMKIIRTNYTLVYDRSWRIWEKTA